MNDAAIDPGNAHGSLPAGLPAGKGPSNATASSGRLAGLRRAWQGMHTRERRLVVFALVLLLVAAVWMLGLAPALRVVRNAPQQLDSLDLQLQAMQRHAAEAAAIQARPPMTREAAVRALEASVRQRLGTATQMRVTGDRATVVLQAVAPDALAQWLAQLRTAARVVPTQAQLRRGAEGWDGTVVLELPPA